MKFAGELIVKAPREQVFDRLKDARFFASCVEGVRDLKEITPTTYSAISKPRSPTSSSSSKSRSSSRAPTGPMPSRPRSKASRTAIVAAVGDVVPRSSSKNDGGTAIQYAIEANLTGRVGSIGQPVLKAKAKEMERLFVQNLHATGW